MRNEETNGVRLSPEERRALLEDIGRVGLLLGKDLMTTQATPSGTTGAATPWERIRQVEALWPQVETTLRALTAQPDQRVRNAALSVPLVRSHGGPAVNAAIARDPRRLAAYLASRKQETVPEPGLAVTEPRPVVSVETPANRLTVTFLATWEREALALASLAETCAESSAAESARRIAASAQKWRYHSVWRSLSPLTERERATRATGDLMLRCPPSYRALFTLWRQSHGPLSLDWSDTPLLRLSLRASWQLYEIWCFLRVAACLRAVGWRATEGDSVRLSPDGLRLALSTGRRSRLRFQQHGHSLDLFYQPLFQSANQVAPNLPLPLPVNKANEAEIHQSSIINHQSDRRLGYSRTHAMQPDVGLWRDGKLYLLDAKFRAYEAPDLTEESDILHHNDALLDDVDKMHAYRDSITGVKEAWCLFPGAPDDTRTIIAYPESALAQPFGTAGIGAIRLRPGCNTLALERLLRHWLED